MGPIPPDPDILGLATQGSLEVFQLPHAAERGANADTISLPPPNMSRSATRDTDAPDSSGVDGANLISSETGGLPGAAAEDPSPGLPSLPPSFCTLDGFLVKNTHLPVLSL